MLIYRRLPPSLAAVALLTAKGYSDKQIAAAMHLASAAVVKQYQSRARALTGTKNKAELAAWWIRAGKSKDMPRVTLIVSTFNRSDKLTCVLYALKVQTFSDFEVIVADNSTDTAVVQLNQAVVAGLRDGRFRHALVQAKDCYTAAEIVSKQAAGEYLGFPSDDNYYVPGFLELLLKNTADLLYCDMIYDPRYNGKWSQIEVHPRLGHIDKGGFLVRRSLFSRFPGDPRLADGLLIEELIRKGATHAKAPGCLWVHN